MSEIILETRNLCKKYRGKHALKNVDIQIHRGDIYGFIGENGAGKTTLLRIVSGLVFPTSGFITLFGKSEQKRLVKERKRISCLIESPAVFPDMTADQNLDIIRTLRGIPGKDCIRDALKAVNLSDVGKKKARNFSLGMKQRLGIAMALLSNPEFLILDEPLNGLDPTNIVELRELLKRINAEKGTTILISSHILSEMHQLATVYGIIKEGQMLEQISSKQLSEACKRHILIKVNNVNKATVVMESKLHTDKFEVFPDQSIKLYDYLDSIGTVSSALAADGLIIQEISIRGDDLETYFMKKIGVTHS